MSFIKFRPSMWEQRICVATQLMRATGVDTIVDIGCGEGRLLQRVALCESFKQVVGFDISEKSLRLAEKNLKPPWIAKLPRHRRLTQLKIQLYRGDVLDVPFEIQEICDNAGACMIEVFEHLAFSSLKDCRESIFGILKPKYLFLTTPNKDFNKLFSDKPEDDKLRHHDHKFEMTRLEFQSWCDDVIRSHPLYEVTYIGLGWPTEESMEELSSNSEMIDCIIAASIQTPPSPIFCAMPTNEEDPYFNDFRFIEPLSIDHDSHCDKLDDSKKNTIAGYPVDQEKWQNYCLWRSLGPATQVAFFCRRENKKIDENLPLDNGRQNDFLNVFQNVIDTAEIQRHSDEALANNSKVVSATRFLQNNVGNQIDLFSEIMWPDLCNGADRRRWLVEEIESEICQETVHATFNKSICWTGSRDELRSLRSRWTSSAVRKSLDYLVNKWPAHQKKKGCQMMALIECDVLWKHRKNIRHLSLYSHDEFSTMLKTSTSTFCFVECSIVERLLIDKYIDAEGNRETSGKTGESRDSSVDDSMFVLYAIGAQHESAVSYNS